MEKMTLSIIKVSSGYQAVIQIRENPYLASREVVYQCSREIKDSLKDAREASRELRKEAKEWARKHKIPYVLNLDLSPYD